MIKLSSFWRRLQAWNLRGSWQPGAHNVVLLISQVVIIWTAAQRGLDYLTSTPQAAAGSVSNQVYSGIEASGASLTLLGWAFLAPALVAFIALSTGWSQPLATGHMVIATSYLVLAISFLRAVPVTEPGMALLGIAMFLVGLYLLMADLPWLPDIIALALGIAIFIIGGKFAGEALGSGYRTGNGFLGAAILHYVFGFGTRVLARRDVRLRREEDEDYRELDAL